jgi:hypothetical protein
MNYEECDTSHIQKKEQRHLFPTMNGLGKSFLIAVSCIRNVRQ